MTNIIKFRAASPEISGNQQPPDRDRLLAMAILVGMKGDLRQYVPTEPHWCQTIGDDIYTAIRRREPIDSTNAKQLTYAFNAAQSKEIATFLKRKPKPRQALSFLRTTDPTGILPRWELEVVSRRQATLALTVGSA